MLAKLRRWRRGTYRFAQEQAAIESWLKLVMAAAQKGDLALARDVAELARLIKGYGDTHARGVSNYERIVAAVVAPALARSDPGAAAAVRRARRAALADPEGTSLDTVLIDLAALSASHAREAVAVRAVPTA
jgi:indolepyruvate ferredoxin oxidoreductase, beta subunit